MYYIVLDLEATCWEKRQGRKNEIIEIGAIKFDENGQQLTDFEAFIKPLCNPVLSDFCTQLTSIEQRQVDEAASFPAVIADFQNWIGADYWLCSWGHYDKNQFRQDCELFGLPTDWLTQHISLKHQYTDICNLRRNIGMKAALQREGFELDGTHHRGIDDAHNIAKIFLRHFESWKFE